MNYKMIYYNFLNFIKNILKRNFIIKTNKDIINDSDKFNENCINLGSNNTIMNNTIINSNKNFILEKFEENILKIIKKYNIIYIANIGSEGIIHIFNKNGDDITPKEYSDYECQTIKDDLDRLVDDEKLKCYTEYEDLPQQRDYLHYRLLK